MSTRSRYERKERRGTIWPFPEKAWARHNKALRAWKTPAFLSGRGKQALIHNGGKP